MQQSLTMTKHHNLTPSQRNTLRELRMRTDIIVLPTDKNLGPSVLERSRYIEMVLTEHLSNQSNYIHLPREQALIKLQQQKTAFLQCYTRHKHELQSEAEQIYFERSTTPKHLAQTRIPQFYGTPKVHKHGPTKLRPVISCVNSIPEIFSKWVDYQLKTTVNMLLPDEIPGVVPTV